MRPLVLYHANCMDGFCAAWLMWKVHQDAFEYRPITYDDPVPDDVDGRDLYLVDFSFKAPVVEDILSRVSRLVILDHHKSAKEELKGFDNTERCHIVFDMDKSGARITQEYLGLPSNWIVDYTEDRDLWRHKLEDSREVNAGLRMLDFDFAVWEVMQQDMKDIVGMGRIICLYQKQLVIAHVEKAAICVFLGNHIVPVVNCTAGDLISDVAGTLAKAATFGVTFFVDGQGRYVYSLRSRGDFDVSELASKYGGGGHKNAAGVTFNDIRHFEVRDAT